MMPDFQVTSPAFSLFERVRSNYCHEDCQVTEDEGIVFGLVYSPLDTIRLDKAGWVYYVYWLSLPSCPWLQPPFLEEALEEDLISSAVIDQEAGNQQGGQSNV